MEDAKNANGSPPTYNVNRLCEWLVITMKDNKL